MLVSFIVLWNLSAIKKSETMSLRGKKNLSKAASIQLFQLKYVLQVLISSKNPAQRSPRAPLLTSSSPSSSVSSIALLVLVLSCFYNQNKIVILHSLIYFQVGIISTTISQYTRESQIFYAIPSMMLFIVTSATQLQIQQNPTSPHPTMI